MFCVMILLDLYEIVFEQQKMTVTNPNWQSVYILNIGFEVNLK